MPFIVSTGAKKPEDPEMRKFIRSHVMIGKNRGKTLRPKNKKAVDSSVVPDPSESSSSPGDEHTAGPLVRTSPRIIPRKVGSDLSLIRFADTIEESSLAIIIEFSTIAKKALFPLESCIAFGAKEMAWMEALTLDAAYLHAMAFSARDYFDLLLGREMAHFRAAPACPHLVTTLRLLRERLETLTQQHQRRDNDDDDKVVKFSTASVVLCLAFHAHIMGDLQAVRHHMQGLRKIVDLKGGLMGFGNVKLAVEILRCDLGMALHSGTKPLFFDDLTREPYWPYPDFTGDALPLNNNDSSSNSVEDLKFLDDLDPELATAWIVTKEFCTRVNRASATQRKLPKEYLFETMVSVMYRLLHMPSPSSSSLSPSPSPSSRFAPGTLNEATRLGLLAFTSSVFLQWAGVRLPYAHFPSLYRATLGSLDLEAASPRLLLWLLTVGAVAVFGSADDVWLRPWLRVNVELCGVGAGGGAAGAASSSWPAMRDILDSFMWVGLVHDGPGKAVFESVIASTPDSSFR
ncbi:hypothetical protein F4677DRAFT_445647 [Hypoxylon crocopeplum]|nr:hypothetical protein F4677DRAFT_445647 [Hypoxylon crocopeplum]